jgi:hypothetical protein
MPLRGWELADPSDRARPIADTGRLVRIAGMRAQVRAASDRLTALRVRVAAIERECARRDAASRWAVP